MQLVWFFLGALAGYWTSEWPRYAFFAESPPITREQMTDPGERGSVALFYPWVFLLGPLLTAIGFVSAYHLAPELSGRFLAAWGAFVLLGAFGTAIGAFELVIGLSPDFWIFGNEPAHRFHLDRARCRTVGSWRVLTCSFLNIMVFLASRVFLS